jgi:5'-deoxynucleotidase YfbR-like HD superfamily hydrolase
MKKIPRSGWISHDVAINDVESIADHSFSTCALALLLADLEARRGNRANVERVLRLALFHDLSETLTFDISKEYLEYLGPKGKRIKAELEKAAWKHVAAGLKNPSLSRTYQKLQEEFESEKTFESKIVHAADALDILLEIVEYTRRGYPRSLFDDMWNQTVRRLRSSQVKSVNKLLETVIQEKDKARSRPVK